MAGVSFMVGTLKFLFLKKAPEHTQYLIQWVDLLGEGRGGKAVVVLRQSFKATAFVAWCLDQEMTRCLSE
jgi:hypothetical protein